MNPSQRVDTVVIGGGVIGASTAWNLCRAGVGSVLLVERNTIGSGASAYAAGLVSHARSDADTLAMVRATLDDIATFEARTGEPVGFRRTGGLRIADTAETARQLRQMAALLAVAGVEFAFVEPAQARAMVPWLDAEGAHVILHLPGDGYVDGQNLAAAYARAAQADGAEVWTGTAVIGPILDRERLLGVETSRGPVHCKRVVDAAGTWAGNVLAWFGHALAAAPLRSHYWITAPAEPRLAEHPVVTFPDARAYTRPEVGGLLVGIQEPVSRSYDDRQLPADIADLALTDEADWDLLAGHALALRRYIPRLDEFAYKQHLAGLTTYTPDGRFLVGSFPGVEGLVLASGCCGTGVSAAGGIGRLASDLALGLSPQVDARPFRPDRFSGEDTRSQAFIARCIATRANKGRRT